MTSKRRVFLDASAWIALFENAPQAAKVEVILEGSGEVSTSMLNFYEVLLWYQNRKPQLVTEVAGHLKAHSALVSLDEQTVLDALRLKQLQPRFSMADAISLATARKLQAQFITTDSDFEKTKGVEYIKTS